MPASKQKNLVILAFSLVVVMLGFGMVIPVFPFYIDKLGAGGSALGLLVATAALTEFLFGPVWGSISDRTGRKPILMIGMFGYALSLVLFGLATELWMLFVSRGLSGILSSAMLSTAMAYIGDSTSKEGRGGGMGLLGASAGVGTIIGPGLGGLLAGGDLSTPFFVGAGLALVAVALIAWLLPESLPQEARAPSVGKIKLVRWGELWQALRGPIGVLLLLAFMATFGTSNFEAVFSLYVVKKMDYTPERVGMILTVMGAVAIVGRGLLTGLATRWFGELKVIRVTLLAGVAGFVFLLLADTYLTVLLSTALFVFITTFLRPSIHSLTSQRSTVGQGTALGLSNSFVSLGRVAGPIWAGALFDLDMSYPYASGAIILLLVFVYSLVWMRGFAERV